MSKNVLITRQISQVADIVNLLSKNRFYPFLLPMIETVGVNFNTKKSVYDYIVFTSANGVKYFFDNTKDVKAHKIITVGSKTEEFLKNYAHLSSITPKDDFSAEGLISFFENEDVKDRNILLVVPEKHTKKHKEFLISKGALVETCIVYKTIELIYENDYVENFIRENKIQVIFFTSPSTVEAFFKNVKQNKYIYNLKYYAIGKTTYDYLKENYNIDACYPKIYTVEKMVDLMIKNIGGKNGFFSS